MNGLQFGDFTVDRTLRQLRRGDTTIPLPAKSFDLLAYMAENPGRPLSKSELLAAVWPDSFVEEANLSQNVFLLRKALGADGSIVTLPGRGYQFAAQVKELAQAPEPPVLMTATHDRLIYEERVEERIAIWRSPLALGLTSVGLAAVALAGWLGWQRYEDRVGGPPVQIIMADIDGGTGDAVLDRTLKDVLRIELAQSPFITVLPGATVRQPLVQMMRQADDPVPLATAREICERTGSQAVVQEHLARVGSGFVVTEEATSCADSSSIGAIQQQVARPEELPRAIDKMANTLRHSLGESRRTIARFNAPLSPVSTSSLEALKDFSQTAPLGQHGKFAECIELLKQAVALDPNFAAAWLDLSTYSDNALDHEDAKKYLQKAYDVRQNSTAPVELLITARYNTIITGDLYAGERNYKSWISLYPRQVQPWSGLTNVYREMGRNVDMLNAAQRTLELAPAHGVAYQALANAQISVGQFAMARTTLETAQKKELDGENLRYLLLRVGHLQGDAALISEQEAWAGAHPDSPILLANLAAYAQAAGQMRKAEDLYDRMDTAFAHLGSPGAGLPIRQGVAEAYLQLGATELGRKALHAGPPRDNLDDLFALAELGEGATADALVKAQVSAQPQDTAWQQFYAPAYRAHGDMLAGRPKDALEELEHARAFDLRSADLMYLRAKAFLQAGMLHEAEAEFRRLLANPGIQPNAYQLPMAKVWLARTLAKEGNTAEAKSFYSAFFTEWFHADPDSPLVVAVRNEIAHLQ